MTVYHILPNWGYHPYDNVQSTPRAVQLLELSVILHEFGISQHDTSQASAVSNQLGNGFVLSLHSNLQRSWRLPQSHQNLTRKHYSVWTTSLVVKLCFFWGWAFNANPSWYWPFLGLVDDRFADTESPSAPFWIGYTQRYTGMHSRRN
jgi:hypothetical protein